MKYFTPERYVALQDFASDAVMNAADTTWEQAAEEYGDYYSRVEASLPAEFRRLQQDYYLHDALVLYMGEQGNRFVIALQLDSPPCQILQLTYELCGAPRINREALPEPHRGKSRAEWMYDEVEVISEAPLLCVHSILCGNGWEVQIPFTSVRLEEVQAVLPAPQTGPLSALAADSQAGG